MLTSLFHPFIMEVPDASTFPTTIQHAEVTFNTTSSTFPSNSELTSLYPFHHPMCDKCGLLANFYLVAPLLLHLWECSCWVQTGKQGVRSKYWINPRCITQRFCTDITFPMETILFVWKTKQTSFYKCMLHPTIPLIWWCTGNYQCICFFLYLWGKCWTVSSRLPPICTDYGYGVKDHLPSMTSYRMKYVKPW